VIALVAVVVSSILHRPSRQRGFIMRRLTFLAEVGIALVIVACGGDATSPPTATAPSPSPPPAVDAAPLALQGLWGTVLTDGEQVTLRLLAQTYQISRGADGASGTIAVNGDQIAFSRSSACNGPDTTGTYRWSLKGDSLLFTAVDFDPCPGRSIVLAGYTYTKLNT
jgi:hypothetical protein